jgi:hypothetical protein
MVQWGLLLPEAQKYWNVTKQHVQGIYTESLTYYTDNHGVKK